MLKVKPYIDKLAWGISIVSFVGFLFIAGLSVVDVFLQRIFNNPILGAYELVERTMLCAVFCAFAYGQTQKSHINMTLVLARMGRVPQMILFSVMGILSTAMAAILAYAAWIQIFSAYSVGTVTGMLHIPLWPFYIVECIAVVVFTITLIYDTALSIGAIFSDQLAEEVRSSWS
jgi:TRAP-type C4-dicarboxylate transport system permease small subunit